MPHHVPIKTLNVKFRMYLDNWEPENIKFMPRYVAHVKIIANRSYVMWCKNYMSLWYFFFVNINKY
jgi:hypothetical protein